MLFLILSIYFADDKMKNHMVKDVIINRSAIREARYNKKISMGQASLDAGIADGILSRIESGNNKTMSATTLYKLAKLYEVTMESLMQEVDS